MKIEIISGSPRQNSVTHRVALHLKNRLQKSENVEVDVIALKDWDIPPIQSVWSSVDKAPEHLRTIVDKMFEADAYILVTPEYNGSYSPALKNFIDHFPKRHHKPFGIVTASPGAMGGMRAAQQLLLLVSALFGIASPYLLVIPSVEKKFSADGDLLDDTFQNSIHNFIAEFTWLVSRVVQVDVPITV